MNNILERMRAAASPNAIEIPFDLDRTPREQIEAVIATVPARKCQRHPHELLAVDKSATVRSALFYDYPYGDEPCKVEFAANYYRCPVCPHNDADHDDEIKDCAVGVVRYFKNDYSTRDENHRPLPRTSGRSNLSANQSAREQLAAWLAKEGKLSCKLSNESLRLRKADVTTSCTSLFVEPQFHSCPQCGLERLGITPDEAHASFENFVVDPPELHQHLEQCRAFAAAPKGVLLLLL